MREIFKPYKDTGYYVSNFGNCYHERTPNVIKKPQSSKTKPYLYIKMTKGYSHLKMLRIDLMVAELFVENPNGYLYLKHKNGDNHDNNSTNLEWVERCEYGGDLNGEIWKPIVGFEGYYEVSNFGRVLSLERIRENGGKVYMSKIMKSKTDKQGYFRVALSRNDGHIHFRPLHRVIAEAFIPNPDNKPQIDHIDGNKTNNSISNLRWATAKENVRNPVTLIKKHYLSFRSKNAMAQPCVAVCISDGNVFDFGSLQDGADFIGVRDSKYISFCCLGRRDNYKGYKWFYKKDYHGRVEQEIIRCSQGKRML